jgi:hypothetical protein
MGARRIAFEEWLAEGRHLPAFLREWQSQKDLFKLLAEYADAQPPGPNLPPHPLPWHHARDYTLQVFLRFLAEHGWTLQPARKEYEFPLIEAILDQCAEQRRQREVPPSLHIVPKET